jgi:hypothetical protein
MQGSRISCSDQSTSWERQQSHRFVGYVVSYNVVSYQKTQENLVEVEPGNIEDV